MEVVRPGVVVLEVDVARDFFGGGYASVMLPPRDPNKSTDRGV